MNPSTANADTLLRRAMLAAQSVNVLQRIRLPPSRLRLPVSRRVYAFSQRIVMNNLGWIIVVLTSLRPSNSGPCGCGKPVSSSESFEGLHVWNKK